MPNSNPSGPNQPLNQRSVPGIGRATLGGDALVFQNMVAGQEYLMVPPPPEGGIREVFGVGFGPYAGMRGGAVAADVEVVYRDANGVDTILRSDALGVDSYQDITPSGYNFYLTPDDQGIFFRFTNGDGNVYLYSHWHDLRTLSREDTDLGTVAANVLPEIPEGNCAEVLSPLLSSPQIIIINYDSVQHTFELFYYDGTQEVQLGAATPATLAGDVVFFTQLITALVPTDAELRVRSVEAVVTTAPRVLAPYILTNLGPIRKDQGSVY